MKIVTTTIEHVIDIARIEAELQASSAWNKNKIHNALSADSICLSALVNDQLVGYVICQYIMDEAEIHIIGVSKNRQGSGVASALLSQLFIQLQEKNVVELFLEVRKLNIPAIKLYKKNDFEQVGIRKNYYKAKLDNTSTREDALVYKKIL